MKPGTASPSPMPCASPLPTGARSVFVAPGTVVGSMGPSGILSVPTECQES